MDRVRVALLALATMTVALSGCAAAPEPAPTDEGPKLSSTSTTGVVRGVVVDEAVRPVGNVDITLKGDGVERSTATDAQGFFGFESLLPGTYFVTAVKLGFTQSQRDVQVVAGVDDPPIVKLQVTFVPGDAPFVSEWKVEAFVQCIVPGANLCAIVNLYPCALAGYCEPIVPDTSFVETYDNLVAQQRVPDWFQAELVWTSTQTVSPQLAVRYSAHSPDDGAGIDDRLVWVHGPSPIAMPIDNAMGQTWELGLAEGVSYEIFGHMEETEAIGSLGFVLNQQVTFYFHAFYGYVPPEGWQFSADGPYPPPV